MNNESSGLASRRRIGLGGLAKVVDVGEQRATPAGAGRVAEVVVGRGGRAGGEAGGRFGAQECCCSGLGDFAAEGRRRIPTTGVVWCGMVWYPYGGLNGDQQRPAAMAQKRKASGIFDRHQDYSIADRVEDRV